MTAALFHIIDSSVWTDAKASGRYAPASLELEGYIHLSRREQILRSANLLYRGRTDLLLLVVDPHRLSVEVVYEPGSYGEAEHFPHLYGALDIEAVSAAVSFPPNADGSFSLPVDLD